MNYIRFLYQVCENLIEKRYNFNRPRTLIKMKDSCGGKVNIQVTAGNSSKRDYRCWFGA